MDGCVIVLVGDYSPQDLGPLPVLVFVVWDFKEERCEDLADLGNVIVRRLSGDGSEFRLGAREVKSDLL